MLDFALHSVPDRLKKEIQLTVDEANKNDTILLGYGLCKWCCKYYITKAHSCSSKSSKWLIDMKYANYKRIVFIHTVKVDKDYIDRARAVPDFLGVSFEERKGSLRLLEKLMSGDWDGEFIVSPPSQIILSRSFM